MEFKNWHIPLLMSFTIFGWGFAFPFISIALQELSFINLTIMRFFIVSIGIIPIIIFRKKKLSIIPKKDIIPLFILGFFGIIVYHLGLNYGEQYLSAGSASLIIASVPIQILILSIFILKEKITFLKIFGIFLGLTGVLIISIFGKKEASFEIDYLFGAFAVIIAAFMAALYTIAGKKMLKRYNGLSLTLYAMVFGSIGLIPFISNSLN